MTQLTEMEQLRDVLQVMRLSEQVKLPMMSKAEIERKCGIYLDAILGITK